MAQIQVTKVTAPVALGTKTGNITVSKLFVMVAYDPSQVGPSQTPLRKRQQTHIRYGDNT